jgi:hypothetical protein
MAAKKAQGVTLGGLRAYGAQAREGAMERAEQLRSIFDELSGKSARKIAAVLNERKITTSTGGVWHAATVIRVQKRLGKAHVNAERKIEMPNRAERIAKSPNHTE